MAREGRNIYNQLRKPKDIKDEISKDKDKQQKKEISRRSKNKAINVESVNKSRLDEMLGLTVTERKQIGAEKISNEEKARINNILRGKVEFISVCEIAEENDINLYHLVYLNYITESEMQNYLSYKDNLNRQNLIAEKRLAEQKRNEELRKKRQEEDEKRRLRKIKEDERKAKMEEERLEKERQIKFENERKQLQQLTEINKFKEIPLDDGINEFDNNLDVITNNQENIIDSQENITDNKQTNESNDDNYNMLLDLQESLSGLKGDGIIESEDDYKEEMKPPTIISKYEDNRRRVYVIGRLKELDLTENSILGYKLIETDDTEKFNSYLANKDSLLVLTRTMTSEIMDILKDWFKGLYDEENEYMHDKFRIITIDDDKLNLEHPIIEDKMKLTRENLDNYYDTHPFEEYMTKKHGFPGLDVFL